MNGRDRSGENNSPGRFVKIGNARINKVKKMIETLQVTAII